MPLKSFIQNKIETECQKRVDDDFGLDADLSAAELRQKQRKFASCVSFGWVRVVARTMRPCTTISDKWHKECMEDIASKVNQCKSLNKTTM